MRRDARDAILEAPEGACLCMPCAAEAGVNAGKDRVKVVGSCVGCGTPTPTAKKAPRGKIIIFPIRALRVQGSADR